MIRGVSEDQGVLTYKAMYKFVEGGVHAEVLDFPGVITSGDDLNHACDTLARALVDMAETTLLADMWLPKPDPSAFDAEADLEEQIHLLVTMTARPRS
jgi:hypothetical protein